MLEKAIGWTLCGLFGGMTSFGQTPPPEQVTKMTAGDAAASDLFGRSSSVSRDTAVVGAPGDDDAGTDSGSAYVFERDQGGAGTWGQVAKLTAGDGAAGDQFGYSVSVDGDTAVVGAYLGGGAGSAYIFERHHGGPDTWGQVAKLTADDGAAGDYFGWSVSISGDAAIVGAWKNDHGATDSGSAYIFERDQGGPDSWGQTSKITASDSASDDYFGSSVSISGDTAIVGAWGDDDLGSNVGMAYAFDRDQGGIGSWGQVARLSPSGSGGHHLGWSVSISGDTAVVGRSDGTFDEWVYVFERHQGGLDQWGQVIELVPEPPTSDDFGFAVSVSGDSIVVGGVGIAGLHGVTPDAGGSGSAYLFQRDEGGPGAWGQVAEILPDDTTFAFGGSVSVDGDTVLIGSYQDNDAGGSAGAAYVFRSFSTAAGPLLDLPSAIPTVTGSTVAVPIELTTNSAGLASLAFSIDYDETCLSFDPTDSSPADGIPDAIDIHLPATFTGITFFDLGDTDGELDFLLFANDPTTTTFSDGPLATLTLAAHCTSGSIAPISAPVLFSADPAPSFGDTDAQAVVGASDDGSIEVFSGIRGDCNADSMVSAPDITACQLEVFDGDGSFWADTLDAVPFLGSPVGCDANADTLVDAGDLSCKARLIFGLVCGGALRAASSEGPRLSIPAELESADGSVVVAVTLEPGDHAVNSLILSLDYDETRLTFENIPGAVRFLGRPVSLRTSTFDGDDTDGELDMVIADLTASQVLGRGVVVEVDFRVLEPGTAPIRDAVFFSMDPAASFGDIEGRSIPGSAEIDTGMFRIFADGFESGDISAWEH